MTAIVSNMNDSVDFSPTTEVVFNNFLDSVQPWAGLNIPLHPSNTTPHSSRLGKAVSVHTDVVLQCSFSVDFLQSTTHDKRHPYIKVNSKHKRTNSEQ